MIFVCTLTTVRYGSDESYLNKYWTLPQENAEGYIEAYGDVLGVADLTNPTSPVKLEYKIIPISDEQKWYRETADANGWFLLTNPYTERVLTDYSGYGQIAGKVRTFCETHKI